MRLHAERLIEQPIESVFACASDITRMPLWVNNFSSPRWIPHGREDAAPAFTGQYTLNGRSYDLTVEISTLRPPSLLVLRSSTPPLAFQSTLSMAPRGDKTLVRYQLMAGGDNAVVGVFVKLFGRLATGMLRRQLDNELASLEALIEGAGDLREVETL